MSNHLCHFVRQSKFSERLKRQLKQKDWKVAELSAGQLIDGLRATKQSKRPQLTKKGSGSGCGRGTHPRVNNKLQLWIFQQLWGMAKCRQKSWNMLKVRQQQEKDKLWANSTWESWVEKVRRGQVRGIDFDLGPTALFATRRQIVEGTN